MLARALVAFAAAACQGGPSAFADGGVTTNAIELRAARGELLMTLAPGDGSWKVELPGQPALKLQVTASRSAVTDAAGAQVAELKTVPGGMQLVDADGTTRRVVFPATGAVNVYAPDGVALVRATTAPGPGPGGDGAVGRDAAGQRTLVAQRQPDRILLSGPDHAVLGTVHNTADELCAVLLGTSGIPLPSRAALAAYVLSR